MNPKEQIDSYISNLSKWQGELISGFRKLIHEVKPDIKEDWKWNVPVWVGKKQIAAASGFTAHVKFNFFQGAALTDSNKLFNSGLDSKKHRSLNIAEGEKVNSSNLKDLIKQAVDIDL